MSDANARLQFTCASAPPRSWPPCFNIGMISNSHAASSSRVVAYAILDCARSPDDGAAPQIVGTSPAGDSVYSFTPVSAHIMRFRGLNAARTLRAAMREHALRGSSPIGRFAPAVRAHSINVDVRLEDELEKILAT
ncbi:hypothetical protein AURDEDRAFT_177632 [Auricularia subglabra TFB-10046 SS5]|uniref:Uncharacterized protein n=1 Tax=Auricularia subglabra (strain TFB-10046 / SS5) TaxID=717982 RepID=J0D3M8_AURST|nr:hypothetical protein AURDEDRAFT_177632 [Auricularia subglabra TFB-10046 SS5]